MRFLIARLEQANDLLRHQLEERFHIVGESIPIKALRKQIAIVAPTNSRVLIYGESGTGKELVSRNIHFMSNRANAPFVEVNCAAIPEELIESELFGHTKGSFTGASEAKKGKFELADGGTLFLDEIGDMSIKTQAKVLRALEEQQLSTDRRAGRRPGRCARHHGDQQKPAERNRARAAFAKICFTGSMSFPSSFRRCANAGKTSRSWRAIS